MTTHPTTVDTRAQFIADLRAFADLLERRPDMPIGDYDTVRVQYSVTSHFGDEAARIAEVERVAAILGVDVERDHEMAHAELDTGRVTYVVHTNTDYGSAAYDAVRSYHGAIEPDMAGAL